MSRIRRRWRRFSRRSVSRPRLFMKSGGRRGVLGKTEIVIDVLPFGLFMEIEGRVNEIRAVERKLAIEGIDAPSTRRIRSSLRSMGKLYDGLIEARF